jgi:adenylate kinase
MRVLMIAPPGAGKGTQGALIAAHFSIPHIATGELLREHVARQTALGRAVQTYLDRGDLVPDQIVLDMVREAMIAAKAAGGGYVLDGIPRNMEQARAAYEIGRELEMTGDVALHLQADDAELTRRLSRLRRVCPLFAPAATPCRARARPDHQDTTRDRNSIAQMGHG